MEIALRLPALHETQRLVYRDESRYKVLACGRRWGKDTLLDRVLLLALLDGAEIAVVHPKDIDSDKVRERHRHMLSDLAAQGLVKWRKSPPRLTGPHRNTLRYYTVRNVESIRGSSLDIFVVNEAGEVATLIDLIRMWEQTVRPALLDRRGAAWFAGTPRGLNGFYTLYQRGIEGASDWRSWRYPTAANPHISRDEIAQMIDQERMSSRAIQQEIEAMFIESGGCVFGDLDRVCILPPREPADIPARSTVIGVDIGGGIDYTAVSVMSAATAPTVEYALYRTRTPVLKQTLGYLTDIITQWNPVEVTVEVNAIGEYYYQELVDALSRRLIRVTPHRTTVSSKAEIIQGMRYAMETRRLLLTTDETGMAELSAYSSSRSATGYVRYSAPKSLYDDTVIARALAYHCAASRPVTYTVRASPAVLSSAPNTPSRSVYRLDQSPLSDILSTPIR